jgi:hypothetical protein
LATGVSYGAVHTACDGAAGVPIDKLTCLDPRPQTRYPRCG